MPIILALVALLIFLIVGIVLIMLIVKSSKKREGVLGMNLNKTFCPKCNTPFPIVRMPANLKEAIFGGWTCKNCGCEVDKWGNETVKRK